MSIMSIAAPSLPVPSTDCDTDTVSEGKRIQHQLDRAERFESLGELACSVAHDFNNILCVIMSYSEMVALAIEPKTFGARAGDPGYLDAIGSDVANIQFAVTRATELTRQLVSFAGREPEHTEPLNLTSAVVGVTGMLGRSLGDIVELITCVAPGTWPILMNLGQLEQVLLNLAVNARYAMPGGGTLSIEAENVFGPCSEDDVVKLRVSDTGSGMSPDTLSHAFEQFFTTKPVDEGTGLGLPSVKRIINGAGGTVQIDSEVGQGTTITMMIPRFRAVAPVVSADDRFRAGGYFDSLCGRTDPLVEDVRRTARPLATRS